MHVSSNVGSEPINAPQYLPTLRILVGRNWPLTEKARPFSQDLLDKCEFGSLGELFDIMESKMRSGIEGVSGVGLAATQLGIPYQLMVLENKEGKILRVVDPIILAYSEELSIGEEGCLSFPHITLPVKRPVEIVVSYQDDKGYFSGTLSLDKYTSRIFQHEYDHLNGKFFFNSLLNNKLTSRQVKRSLERNLKKLDERGLPYSLFMKQFF